MEKSVNLLDATSTTGKKSVAHLLDVTSEMERVAHLLDVTSEMERVTLTGCD